MELIPRFHQELFVKKTIDKIDNGYNKILWGWKCRAGKTYGVGHLIEKYHEYFEGLNALIITPAPSETLSQFGCEMFNKFINFRYFNIFEIKKGSELLNIDEEKKKIVNKDKNNVFVVSKQLLNNYLKIKNKNSKENLYFHLINFDLIIFDENHFGGTTENSKEILNLFSNHKSCLLFLTATYQKTLISYKIDKSCQFYWNIEDENYCKNRSIEKLAMKHGFKDVNYFLNLDNQEIKLSYYDNMPELHLISTLMDVDKFEKIKEGLNQNENGFSMDVLFSMDKKTNAFIYKKEVKQVLKYICNEDNNKYVTNIYTRIIELSKKNKSRTILENKNFTTQLWFLPFGIGLKIDDLSKNLKNLMLELDEFNNYEIIIPNSKVKEIKNLKKHIFDIEKNSYLNNKKGLILLAGNQCSLGITLPLVDIVFLINNISSSDKIMQMMYRCMSETNDGSKKIGFVVDFNINRILHTFIDYPLTNDLSISNSHQKISFMIENNLIHLDEDIFESKNNKTELIEKLLVIWKNDPENEQKILEKRIKNLHFNIEEKEQKIINEYFYKLGNSFDEHFVRFDDEIFQNLPKGIQKIPIYNKYSMENLDDDYNDMDDEINDKSNQILIQEDILPLILPLIAFMNIDENNINNEYENVNISTYLINIGNNKELKEVINDYMFMLWDKKNLFDFIHLIINKFLNEVREINNILYHFRMVFNSLINKPDELANYLKSSLKPKELEKKKFGEVFTPNDLIDIMMDQLDESYKKEHKKSIFTEKNFKWYDPACGMGGFIVNVYYRLMKGLKKEIKDEDKRKKHILENMLYMGEINKKNCYILKKLFNYKKFKLNIYCGNSLNIDLKKAFGFDNFKGFDVIMGNPPFQDKNKSGDNKKYLEFTSLSMNQLGTSKYLIFITPRNIIDYLLLHQKNRKYITKLYNIDYLSIETCSKYFKVGSSFLWFILKNENYKGTTTIEYLDLQNQIKKTKLKLTEGINIPRYPSDIDLKIIKKLTGLDNKFKIKDVLFENKTQRIRKEIISKGIVKEKKSDEFKYKIIDTINKTNPFPPEKFYYYNKKDNDFDKTKLVISKKGYLMPFIDETNQYTYSDNFKIIVDTKKNLDNILKIFNSCIVEYLIKQFSKHGFDNIKALELLNEKIKIHDDDIYKTYNLNNDEKNHIITFVKNC